MTSASMPETNSAKPKSPPSPSSGGPPRVAPAREQREVAVEPGDEPVDAHAEEDRSGEGCVHGGTLPDRYDDSAAARTAFRGAAAGRRCRRAARSVVVGHADDDPAGQRGPQVAHQGARRSGRPGGRSARRAGRRPGRPAARGPRPAGAAHRPTATCRPRRPGCPARRAASRAGRPARSRASAARIRSSAQLAARCGQRQVGPDRRGEHVRLLRQPRHPRPQVVAGECRRSGRRPPRSSRRAAAATPSGRRAASTSPRRTARARRASRRRPRPARVSPRSTSGPPGQPAVRSSTRQLGHRRRHRPWLGRVGGHRRGEDGVQPALRVGERAPPLQRRRPGR